MKKISLYTSILVLASPLIILGAGCSLENLSNPAVLVNNTNETSVLSETQYYNKVIQTLNTTADQNTQIQNTYRMFAEATSAESRAEIFKPVDSTVYDTAKNTLLNDTIVMQRAEAQDTIEVQLESYFDQYHSLLKANNAVAEYYQRGQYKDDQEAKKDELLNTFTEALHKVTASQVELFDVIGQYQNQVDLGIDANTTDPLEVVTLTQDTITKDAEQLFKGYQVWIQAYSKDNTTADLSTMQTDFDKLSADYKTYQQRASDVNVAVKTEPALSTAFQEYMESVNLYSIKLENVLRDGKNKAIVDVTTLDSEVVQLYNGLIDKHNELVNQVQAQAK